MKHPIIISSEGKTNTERYHRSLRLSKRLIDKGYLPNSNDSISSQMERLKEMSDEMMNVVDKILDKE